MKSYSGNTRIELTAKGWLYSVESVLKAFEQSPDTKKSAELRRRAKKVIQMALVAVHANCESRETRGR
jgi:hypothetical protein